jgi:MFS family permease
LGLGSLKYVNDKESFIKYSFLWKFMCGIGSGINSTASMAIVSTHYKNERERAIGLIEAASGVGLLLGPFFGALLYEIGGYMLPFIATGKILYIFTIYM